MLQPCPTRRTSIFSTNFSEGLLARLVRKHIVDNRKHYLAIQSARNCFLLFSCWVLPRLRSKGHYKVYWKAGLTGWGFSACQKLELAISSGDLLFPPHILLPCRCWMHIATVVYHSAGSAFGSLVWMRTWQWAPWPRLGCPTLPTGPPRTVSLSQWLPYFIFPATWVNPRTVQLAKAINWT